MLTSPSDGKAFRAVMGCKYKETKVFHRSVLIRDYSQFHFHADELQSAIQTSAGFGGWLWVTPLLPIVPATV